MKVLVAIASYGTNNDAYLHQLIDTYAQMPYEVDVVVVSNVDKPLPPSVELIVGMPSRNPWSLPFAHKAIFTERVRAYDLFIYSEDDTLITQAHVDAFLGATATLPSDEIAGFLRSEQAPDGTIYYSTIHHHFHWDVHSVRRRGEEIFAHFTNDHGACYMLTQEQLRRAIASGGFAVGPHEGKYDMLVSAATDPYTQCGFKKFICISRLEAFTCRHLTNKYIGRTGVVKALVDIQVRALMKLQSQGTRAPEAIRVEPRLMELRWAKSYYEASREDLLEMIPATARRVLSLGCGWGATERSLLEHGLDVSAIPLDSAIGRVADATGVTIVDESLSSAPSRFTASSFDVVLMTGLLHLIEDPVVLLRQYGALLAENGRFIVTVPNIQHLAVRLRSMMRDRRLDGLDDYRRGGVHKACHRQVRAWFEDAGLTVTQVKNKIEGRWVMCDRLTVGLAPGLWSSEFTMSAVKRA